MSYPMACVSQQTEGIPQGAWIRVIPVAHPEDARMMTVVIPRHAYHGKPKAYPTHVDRGRTARDAHDDVQGTLRAIGAGD